jgi:hypothetical protein
MFYAVSNVNGDYVNTTVCETEDIANDIVAARKVTSPNGEHYVSEEYPTEANPVESDTTPGHDK